MILSLTLESLELLGPVDVGNAIARELVRLIQIHIDPGCVVDRCQGLPCFSATATTTMHAFCAASRAKQEIHVLLLNDLESEDSQKLSPSNIPTLPTGADTTTPVGSPGGPVGMEAPFLAARLPQQSNNLMLEFVWHRAWHRLAPLPSWLPPLPARASDPEQPSTKYRDSHSKAGRSASGRACGQSSPEGPNIWPL